MIKGFAPTSKKEMNNLGWKNADVIIVTGDPYIDHPAFKVATAAKYLLSKGFRTAIIDNPRTDSFDDFTALGKPRLFFLVITGEKDSMVVNYSAQKRFRSADEFMPGGKKGNRPDRAVIKYTNILKQNFKGVPVVLSGIEAEDRRFAHYDFWSEKIRKPILFDSKADYLVYGNIEFNLEKLANHFKNKHFDFRLEKQRGIAFISNEKPDFAEVELEEFDEVKNSDEKFVEYVKTYRFKTDNILVQKVLNRYLVVMPPHWHYSSSEMNSVFNLSYTRKACPKYKEEIPYFAPIKTSIVSHRGKIIDKSTETYTLNYGFGLSTRDNDSIFREAHYVSKGKTFNSMIKSLYGPDSYHYGLRENKFLALQHYYPNEDKIKKYKPQLEHTVRLLEKIDTLSGLRNHFIASEGDFVLMLSNSTLMKDYIKHRCGSKVVFNIESCDDNVRKYMNIPSFELFAEFLDLFRRRCGEYGKYIEVKVNVTVGLPGESVESVINNVLKLKKLELEVEKVKRFVPLPMTRSCLQYFTKQDYKYEDIIETSRKKKEIESMEMLYKNTNKANHKQIRFILKDHNRIDDLNKIIR